MKHILEVEHSVSASLLADSAHRELLIDRVKANLDRLMGIKFIDFMRDHQSVNVEFTHGAEVVGDKVKYYRRMEVEVIRY